VHALGFVCVQNPIDVREELTRADVDDPPPGLGIGQIETQAG
jgi:hypothetical protein